MTQIYKFYSFFTKYSLMEDYGFTSGIVSRIFRKFIPEIPAEDRFEFYLDTQLKSNKDALSAIKTSLADTYCNTSINTDLNKAIAALATKIISFGYDHKFQTAFERTNIDAKCYDKLLCQLSTLTEEGKISFPEFHISLDGVYETIVKLRKNKNIIGTSLHLTVVTKNLLDYIDRTKKLLDLKMDIHSEQKWEDLIEEYIQFEKSRNSVRKYFGSHMDLLALEIVEHTAQKGEKYVADNNKEYREFFKKGLLGGLVIAVFALVKILIGSAFSGDLAHALLYSFNYALCFILVSHWGGVIATKQPAMTASTIARHIDKDGDLHYDTLQDIILLIRKISRSQFISLLGNFLTALSASSLIGYLLSLGYTPNPIYAEKSTYLVDQVFPFSSGAIFYAAIAGVFLSASGFISGYFDNKIKASNLSYRILHSKLLSHFLAPKKLKNLALFTEKSIGLQAGNISLGFFLGTAFLFSFVLPFNIDIRHIAFSSANIGYGLINQAFDLQTVAYALASVLIIGLVNFVVSFSITFLTVLKSRDLRIRNLGKLIRLSAKDIFSHPLDYIMIRNSKNT